MSDPDHDPTVPDDWDDELAADRATPIEAADVEADPADLWEQSLPGSQEDDDDAYEHTT